MRKLHLIYSAPKDGKHISLFLPPSKSIEARRLILASLRGLPLTCYSGTASNLPDDLVVLREALLALEQGESTISVGESGTAMRFMLAYIAARTTNAVQLLGMGRQHERPIKPLVDALRLLGADITYIKTEGYPPLLIKPSKLKAQRIELDASKSSQYLSALLLIAPLIEGEGYSIDTSRYGLTSLPYALITIKEMRDAGFIWQQNGLLFSYQSTSVARVSCCPRIEADWSAASYAYLLMSILDKNLAGYTTELRLPNLVNSSSQGDSKVLTTIYEALGVRTTIETGGVMLSLMEAESDSPIVLDCRNTPDLVPALVASMVANGRRFTLTGVAHLRIKESNRLEALQTELDKVGVRLTVDDDSISWDGERNPIQSLDVPLILNPHHDHRIAMALAPLMAKLSPLGVIVDDADCVTKSYPMYWQEIEKLDYTTKTL